jgi:hypothetical protein
MQDVCSRIPRMQITLADFVRDTPAGNEAAMNWTGRAGAYI